MENGNEHLGVVLESQEFMDTIPYGNGSDRAKGSDRHTCLKANLRLRSVAEKEESGEAGEMAQ